VKEFAKFQNKKASKLAQQTIKYKVGK